MNKKFIILGIILGIILIFGCSKQISKENQISKITVDVNGMTEEKELSKSISLPVNEEEAGFLAGYCPECTSGDLELKDGFWVIFQGEEYPICSTKIEVNTGNVFCELYG